MTTLYDRFREYFKKTSHDFFHGNARYRTNGFKFLMEEDSDHMDYTAEVECTHPVVHWIVPFIPASFQKGNYSIFCFAIKARMYSASPNEDQVLHVFIQSMNKDPVYFRIHLRLVLDFVETARTTTTRWLRPRGEKDKNNNPPAETETMKFRIILQEIHFDKIEFCFPVSPVFLSILKRQVDTMLRNDLHILSKQMSRVPPRTTVFCGGI